MAKGPRMPDDQKVPDLSAEEVRLIASSIINRLDRLEEIFPFLATREYPLYRQMRHAIETEGVEPSDSGGFILGSIYASLVIVLKNMSEERASIRSIHVLNMSDINLGNYLPETFSGMIEKFTSEVELETRWEAIKCAAESIIMGELEGGIASVIRNLQGEVMVEIMEILTEHEGPESDHEEKGYEFLEEDEFFEVLEHDDAQMHMEADWRNELDETSNTRTVMRKKLARAILGARDGIDSKYGDGVTKLDSAPEEKDNDGAIAEIIWKRILELAGKGTQSVTLKSTRERRAKLAERILLPKTERGRQELRVVKNID